MVFHDIVNVGRLLILCCLAQSEMLNIEVHENSQLILQWFV